MPSNKTFETAAELPHVIPVFPLAGAILLPRADLPLNIFEPRYLAMADDALKSDRFIGIIQPDPKATAASRKSALASVGCAGRLTHWAETGDGRVQIALTGIARFRVETELAVLTPYRRCQVSYAGFEADLIKDPNEAMVDRKALVSALRAFSKARRFGVDWKAVETSSNEDLVNTLTLMCPYGPPEKQALLEASDLQARADMLVALTEIELANSGDGPRPALQ